MFYIFVIDIFVLGYVGAHPPSLQIRTIGEVSTTIYFLTFLLLPFVSRWEEKFVLARGLPPAVEAMARKEIAEAEGNV